MQSEIVSWSQEADRFEKLGNILESLLGVLSKGIKPLHEFLAMTTWSK